MACSTGWWTGSRRPRRPSTGPSPRRWPPPSRRETTRRPCPWRRRRPAGRTCAREKVVSRRYRYVWLCNPKAASRSIIAALRAADPDAEVIRQRTLDEILAARPEVKSYWSFAFVRHPCRRAYSFYVDKHGLARSRAEAHAWFIDPYFGLRTGMRFDEVCRWLNTPYGSDAFADRHWLSQHRQIRIAGRLPDFVGACERLDDDWRTVTRHLRLPFRKLPPVERPRGGPGGRRGARRRHRGAVAAALHRRLQAGRLRGAMMPSCASAAARQVGGPSIHANLPRRRRATRPARSRNPRRDRRTRLSWRTAADAGDNP